MKAALVNALCACASDRQKRKARRFLEGLSEDELRYIADFLGARILESAAGCAGDDPRPGQNVAAFERAWNASAAPHRPSARLGYQEHKMILLREYLSRCAMQESAGHVRVRRHAG